MIVPCNERAQFGHLTGDSVQFRDCRRTYKVQVQKEPTRTRLGGEGWCQFVARHHLTGDGELVSFSLEGIIPKIIVIYLNNGSSEPLVSQRCNLTNGESEHIQQIILARNSFIGVSFVTRLTRTNVKKNLWYVYIHILFKVTLSPPAI
jgi:hypothetical protein